MRSLRYPQDIYNEKKSSNWNKDIEILFGKFTYNGSVLLDTSLTENNVWMDKMSGILSDCAMGSREQLSSAVANSIKVAELAGSASWI